MFQDYKLRNYDFKLILMVLALSIVGVLAVGSAEESLQTKQILGVVAGMVLMIGISLFNYKWLLKLNWFMYIGNLLLLLLVKFLGDEGGYGAQRWLEIGSFRFQPSETAKILLILFFAQFIMKRKKIPALRQKWRSCAGSRIWRISIRLCLIIPMGSPRRNMASVDEKSLRKQAFFATVLL